MENRFLDWNQLNDVFGIPHSEPPEDWNEMPEFSSDIPPWNKGTSGLQEAWNKGVPHSEETKDKIRRKATGRLTSDATRAKMSQSRRGVARPQTSEAISKGRKGVPCTWGDKISKARKGKPTGRKMSEEQKRKMYEARWKRPYPDK